MVAGRTIPLVFEVAGAGVCLPPPSWPWRVLFGVLVLVCIFLPLRMIFGVSSGVMRKSTVMLVWIAAVLLCRFRVLFRRFNELIFGGAILALQIFWPGHMSIDNLDVVRSSARLLDHGSLSKPLPLVKVGLFAAVRHMKQVGLPKSRVMPLRLMLNRVGSGWRINLEMLRLTLLLTSVGDINLRGLWMQGGLYFTLGSSGIPLCFNCIGSWLRFPGSLSIMMVGVGRPLIPLSVIIGVA